MCCMKIAGFAVVSLDGYSLCLPAKVWHNKSNQSTSVCTLCACICAWLHVFVTVLCVCVLNPWDHPLFILSSSSLTALILSSLALFSAQSFIHLSPYPVISRSHPLSLLPSPAPLVCLFPPFLFQAPLIFPSPSIPSSLWTQFQPDSADVWILGIRAFFSPQSSVPPIWKRSARNCTLQIKRLLTMQCWKVTELSQKEKGAMQRNPDPCWGSGSGTRAPSVLWRQLQQRDDELGAFPRSQLLSCLPAGLPTTAFLQLTGCHAINKSSKKAAMQWGSHSVLSGSQCVDGRRHLLPSLLFVSPGACGGSTNSFFFLLHLETELDGYMEGWMPWWIGGIETEREGKFLKEGREQEDASVWMTDSEQRGQEKRGKEAERPRGDQSGRAAETRRKAESDGQSRLACWRSGRRGAC